MTYSFVSKLIAGCTALSFAACAQTGTAPSASVKLSADTPVAIKALAETAPNNNKAKNVILFVGDGMGISTITAGRIFDGQSKGQSGEENSLSFETMPYTALVKTYNTNAQVPDSAGTASAMNMGIKTDIGKINERPGQFGESCKNSGADAEPLKLLAEQFEDMGLSTGIVSTARLTHATPAAVYAHSPSRGFEHDGDIAKNEMAVAAGCEDIASQLLSFSNGDGIDVALGGGRRAFLPDGAGGRRLDGRDLTVEWDGIYVSDRAGLMSLDSMSDEKVLGLFQDSHMSYEADRNPDVEPSLSELTAFAIDKLESKGTGYYLMVEAGRIDHAHHGSNAARALEDTQEMSEAVAVALSKVDLDNTLVLVTADHSHVFTMAGYPARGNPILGISYPVDRDTGLASDEPMTDIHGKPYTTLGYHNGENVRTIDSAPLTDDMVADLDYQQQVAVEVSSETHGGEDVALFAAGPRAHIVRGVIEQNLIYHIMTYALGWHDAKE